MHKYWIHALSNKNTHVSVVLNCEERRVSVEQLNSVADELSDASETFIVVGFSYMGEFDG